MSKRDPFVAQALAVADGWEKEAGEREKRAPGVPDPVAATLKTNATELRERLEAAERDLAYLTVAQWAEQHDVGESTVRRLCADGQLPGAERGANNDWRIPRGAKRRAVAS